MTSEWRDKLCGITTAPSTLIITIIEPLGNAGVTQPVIALFQSIFTNESSYKNDNPIIETNAIIHFSINRYELVKSIIKNENLSDEDIEKIPGSGADGKINKEDVVNYINKKSPQQTVTSQPEKPQKVEFNFIK